jgi:CheY-like chemotaxis protein
MSDISDSLYNGSTSAGKRRVLVAEDDFMIRKMLKSICEMSGCEVVTAAHGIEALDIYVREHDTLGLILTDNDMPHMKGTELMRQIKQKGNGVPVVLVSGDTFRPEEWQGMGFADYLQKPYRLAEIMGCIEKYLG